MGVKIVVNIQYRLSMLFREAVHFVNKVLIDLKKMIRFGIQRIQSNIHKCLFLVKKLGDMIYEFCIQLKSAFWIRVIYTFVGLHLTLFALAFGKYELSVFRLDNKVTNLITLAGGKNLKLALERIPMLQRRKIPIEPKIYNPLSVFYSLNSNYDDVNFEVFNELRFLVISNKYNLSDLNLNGIILRGFGNIRLDHDFNDSKFLNISFIQAGLNHNIFTKGKFIKVDLWGANMENCDLAFSEFYNSSLRSTKFKQSNLCGVKLINTDYTDADFRQANLIGVDLSAMSIVDVCGMLPKLQGAYYNSSQISIINEKQFIFITNQFPSCTKKSFFQPTKFPNGFDPKKEGMIDISDW